MVPVTPQLLTILQDGFDAAKEGQERIVGRSQNNLQRDFEVIVARAGMAPWASPFQVLRSSRETEWSERFPGHVVAQWMGHSENVSRKHYLQVPDHFYERAAEAGAVECAAAGSRNDSQRLANGPTPDPSTQVDDFENACFPSVSSENETGPGGIRTCDQSIMSRPL